MSAADYEVAIVGGGPCGLLTALLLARRGVRCAVFEAKVEPLRLPRAMSISRRSAEIFQQLGLRERMLDSHIQPGAYDLAIWAGSLCGEVYGRVAWPEDDPAIVPYPAYHCPQTTTESVLLEALEAERDASIFFDHEVTMIEEVTGVVQLDVRRGRHDQSLSLTARYVVAADGAGSPARHALGIDAIGPGDLGHFLNTFFRAPYGAHWKEKRAVLAHILRQDLFEVFVAVNGDDLWLMHHFLQPDEKPSDYTPERLAEIVKNASGLPDVPVEVLGVSPWVMSPKVAAQFRKGRVFLTGDAAARLSPAGGLGMNTGLQSAHNLAWKLAAVLHGAPESLLDTYDAERRTHVMHTFENSGRLGAEVWTILEAGFAGDFEKVRELVAGSRRGGSGLGLDFGWNYKQSSAFDPNSYVPSAERGCRAPHLWLERDGLRLSTIDLFGRGFALLVAGDATRWRAVTDPTATFGGFDVEVFQVDSREGYRDVDGKFPEYYGVQTGDAVLVRPDGVACWRSADPAGLAVAIQSILTGG
ncbi:MAG: FAD-dependent monooxygenase [Chthoniobacterales bacterium]